MHTIAVVGGGAAGALVVINLIKYYEPREEEDVQVIWIEKSGEWSEGLAYQTNKDYHILNVPANLMGVYHNNITDFYDWLQQKGFSYSEHDYVSRKIYSTYLKERLNFHLAENTKIKIVQIKAEVVDIDILPSNCEYQIALNNGNSFIAHSIVLATGNFLTKDPILEDMSYVKNKNYFTNPWINSIDNNIKQDDTVFIIGTGLTMIDKLLDLFHQNHKGKIYAISRHGYLPFTQYPCSRHQQYPDYSKELIATRNVEEIQTIIKKHIDLAIKSGIDWRVAVDVIRPHLADIWTCLPIEEKKYFVKRYSAIWQVTRHRIPILCADILNLLKDRRQLKIIRANLQYIEPTEDGFNVCFVNKELEEKTVSAQKIINCTGPQTSGQQIENKLIQNLVQKGTIAVDELGIGFNALPNGNLLNKNKLPLTAFYTLGSNLRGILFESIAIPEIRNQAFALVKYV